MNTNLANLPEPHLWEMLENGKVTTPNDPLIYLEIRNAIEKSLRKLKRSKKVDVFGGCVGMDADNKPTEFIIGFGYKGRVVSLKGLIGEPNGKNS